MMKDIMKKSVKKLLGMAVAVCMVFGAGMTAEAATYGNADKIDYGTLKKGDIIGKDTIIIIPAGILPVKLQNYNTGEETPGLANTRAKLSMYQIFPAKRYEVVGMTAEESFLRLELKAYKTSGPAVSAGVMTDEERAEQERLDREAAWKISKDNPDNYLPKITLSDGTKLQSSVASHFKKNKDSSISEVLMNMPEQEVNAAFGVTGKAYIHINAYKSQCGPGVAGGIS